MVPAVNGCVRLGSRPTIEIALIFQMISLVAEGDRRRDISRRRGDSFCAARVAGSGKKTVVVDLPSQSVSWKRI